MSRGFLQNSRTTQRRSVVEIKGFAGDRDYRQVRQSLPQRADDLNSLDVRHDHVSNNRISVVFGYGLLNSITVFKSASIETQFLETGDIGGPHGEIVFDNQYPRHSNYPQPTYAVYHN